LGVLLAVGFFAGARCCRPPFHSVSRDVGQKPTGAVACWAAQPGYPNRFNPTGAGRCSNYR
jgi:hypothetical protein